MGNHEPDIATDGGDLFVDIVASASSFDCDRSLGLREGGAPRVASGSSHPQGLAQVPLGGPVPSVCNISSISVTAVANHNNSASQEVSPAAFPGGLVGKGNFSSGRSDTPCVGGTAGSVVVGNSSVVDVVEAGIVANKLVRIDGSVEIKKCVIGSALNTPKVEGPENFTPASNTADASGWDVRVIAWNSCHVPEATSCDFNNHPANIKNSTEDHGHVTNCFNNTADNADNLNSIVQEAEGPQPTWRGSHRKTKDNPLGALRVPLGKTYVGLMCSGSAPADGGASEGFPTLQCMWRGILFRHPTGLMRQAGRGDVSIGERPEAAEAQDPRESATPIGLWEPRLQHVYQLGVPRSGG